MSLVSTALELAALEGRQLTDSAARLNQLARLIVRAGPGEARAIKAEVAQLAAAVREVRPRLIRRVGSLGESAAGSVWRGNPGALFNRGNVLIARTDVGEAEAAQLGSAANRLAQLVRLMAADPDQAEGLLAVTMAEAQAARRAGERLRRKFEGLRTGVIRRG